MDFFQWLSIFLLGFVFPSQTFWVNTKNNNMQFVALILNLIILQMSYFNFNKGTQITQENTFPYKMQYKIEPF